jgi:hypothetical protein
LTFFNSYLNIQIYENNQGFLRKQMNTFLLKLILTFLVGGTWITFATVLAEKYDTKPGGIIAGFPTTAAIALFFIAWTQTPALASLTND